MTSTSENEMNIRIPLCNVRHLNGMLNIKCSGNLSEKDALTEKKFKILEKKLLFDLILEILNAVM